VVSLDDGIHRIGSDPLWVPEDAKDPVRRLRGQLAAPVSVWTTYAPDGSGVGITVSSVLIAEDHTPSIMGLIAPLSDFWDAVQASKRFVIHVLSADQVRIADQFALRYPGDAFEGLSTSMSDHGPILDDVPTWAKCSLTARLEAGWSLLLKGSLEDINAAATPPLPLVHYRGRYLTIGPRRTNRNNT
jgi:3-hydroxy-9,10-secoandrosta-1,3,5(10)-triene-9,17-dione monooxygenase reductase component